MDAGRTHNQNLTIRRDFFSSIRYLPSFSLGQSIAKGHFLAWLRDLPIPPSDAALRRGRMQEIEANFERDITHAKGKIKTFSVEAIKLR